MRSYKQRTKRRRGGNVNSSTNISNVGMCKYNVNDSNVRVNSEDPYELHQVYQTCCPKKKSLFFGSKKNTSPFCKSLEPKTINHYISKIECLKNMQHDKL